MTTRRTIDRTGMPPACDACTSTTGTIRYNTYMPQHGRWGWVCTADLRFYGSPDSSMTEKVRFTA